MSSIYLDNNASTQIDPQVLSVMQPYLEQLYGNPNSAHDYGTATHEGIDNASDQIYSALNATNDDSIIITSGATESINTIHKSILFDYIKNKGIKNQIITSALEHSAVQGSLQYLSGFGIEIITIPHQNYTITVDDFLKYFNPEKTLLVSIMYVNSETGIILPIKQIATIAKENNTLVHTDATQALGKIPIDLQELPVDYLSFSAHKFHGPKGVGGLFVRDKAPLIPLIHGSKGFRSGTPSPSHIIGLGKALDIAVKNLEENNKNILRMRTKLEDFLHTIPNVTILGEQFTRIPNTCFIQIPNIDPQQLSWILNKQEIAISTGSACSTQQLNTISSKAKAIGCRFSLSRFTTDEEIDQTIDTLSKILIN